MVQADNAIALVFRVLKPLVQSDQQQLIDTVADITNELPVQLWLKFDKDQAPQLIYPQEAEPLTHTVDQQTLNIQLDDFVQVNRSVNQADRKSTRLNSSHVRIS